MLAADVQFHETTIAYLQAVAQRHQDTVALFVALGGGWWNGQRPTGRRRGAMKYSGILRIGFKLLVNDKAKFSALLIGITFAVFLMMQMTAMFAGILNRAYSTVTNIGAAMWIMDPAVNTATSAIPLPDYLLDAVRSMDGVSYAVPLFIGGALVKLDDGTYQSVNVVGLDDTSLFGRPELEQGNIQDIYADNSFLVVDDAEFSKLENPKIGTSFELNDHRGAIVGIARVASNGLNGVPTLYTTYSRAIEYIPTTRFTISYVLVQPKSEAAVAGIKQQVAKLGYVAFTKEEFNKRITDFYTYQDRYWHQHPVDDGDQLHRWTVDLGPDLLHLHPRKPGEIRRAEGHRREGARAGLHDPVHGDLYRADRLRPGRRPGDADDLDRPIPAAQLRRDDHFLEPGSGLRHGRADRRNLQLCRGTQGPQNRAVRHLPGLAAPPRSTHKNKSRQSCEPGRNAPNGRAGWLAPQCRIGRAMVWAASSACFAMVPIATLLVAPAPLRIPMIAALSLLSLAVLGAFGGRLGGALAMAVTAIIGRILGVAAG